MHSPDSWVLAQQQEMIDCASFLDVKEIQKLELWMPETLLTLLVGERNPETVRSGCILLQVMPLWNFPVCIAPPACVYQSPSVVE